MLLHLPKGWSILADSAATVSVLTKDKKWQSVLPAAVTTTATDVAFSLVAPFAFIAPNDGAALPLASNISCGTTVQDHLSPVKCPTHVLGPCGWA